MGQQLKSLSQQADSLFMCAKSDDEPGSVLENATKRGIASGLDWWAWLLIISSAIIMVIAFVYFRWRKYYWIPPNMKAKPKVQCKPEDVLAKIEADNKKRPKIIENAMVVTSGAHPNLGLVTPLDINGRPVDAHGRPFPTSSSASSILPQPPSSSSTAPPARRIYDRPPTGNVLPVPDEHGNFPVSTRPSGGGGWFPTFGDDRRDRVMAHDVRGQIPSRVTGTAMPAYAIDLNTGAPAASSQQAQSDGAAAPAAAGDDGNERNIRPDQNSVPPPQAGAAMAPQIGTGPTWVERDDMPTPTYFANGTAGEGVIVDAVAIPTSQGIITQTAWFDIPPHLQQ